MLLLLHLLALNALRELKMMDSYLQARLGLSEPTEVKPGHCSERHDAFVSAIEKSHLEFSWDSSGS